MASLVELETLYDCHLKLSAVANPSDATIALLKSMDQTLKSVDPNSHASIVKWQADTFDIDITSATIVYGFVVLGNRDALQLVLAKNAEIRLCDVIDAGAKNHPAHSSLGDRPRRMFFLEAPDETMHLLLDYSHLDTSGFNRDGCSVLDIMSHSRHFARLLARLDISVNHSLRRYQNTIPLFEFAQSNRYSGDAYTLLLAHPRVANVDPVQLMKYIFYDGNFRDANFVAKVAATVKLLPDVNITISKTPLLLWILQYPYIPCPQAVDLFGNLLKHPDIDVTVKSESGDNIYYYADISNCKEYRRLLWHYHLVIKNLSGAERGIYLTQILQHCREIDDFLYVAKILGVPEDIVGQWKQCSRIQLLLKLRQVGLIWDKDAYDAECVKSSQKKRNMREFYTKMKDGMQTQMGMAFSGSTTLNEIEEFIEEYDK